MSFTKKHVKDNHRKLPKVKYETTLSNLESGHMIPESDLSIVKDTHGWLYKITSKITKDPKSNYSQTMLGNTNIKVKIYDSGLTEISFPANHRRKKTKITIDLIDLADLVRTINAVDKVIAQDRPSGVGLLSPVVMGEVKKGEDNE